MLFMSQGLFLRDRLPSTFQLQIKWLSFLGKNFNKEGNSKNWWSPESENGFKTQAKCLVDQYSKYSLYGRNVRMSSLSYLMKFSWHFASSGELLYFVIQRMWIERLLMQTRCQTSISIWIQLNWISIQLQLRDKCCLFCNELRPVMMITMLMMSVCPCELLFTISVDEVPFKQNEKWMQIPDANILNIFGHLPSILWWKGTVY